MFEHIINSNSLLFLIKYVLILILKNRIIYLEIYFCVYNHLKYILMTFFVLILVHFKFKNINYF